MPSLGAPEIVIILVIALLVFGPKRLPEMGRSLGRSVREFKKASDTARKEFGVDEIERELKDVKNTLGDVKGDLKIDIDAETAKPATGGAGAAAAAAVIAADTVAAGSDGDAAPAEIASHDEVAIDDPVDDAAPGEEVLVGEVMDDDVYDGPDAASRSDEVVGGEPVDVEPMADGWVGPQVTEDETAAGAPLEGV